MGTDKVGTVLNAFITAMTILLALAMLHNGALLIGFITIIVAMVWVFLSVDEFQEATDPLEQYAPGGAKYTPTPWNTERVAVKQ